MYLRSASSFLLSLHSVSSLFGRAEYVRWYVSRGLHWQSTKLDVDTLGGQLSAFVFAVAISIVEGMRRLFNDDHFHCEK